MKTIAIADGSQLPVCARDDRPNRGRSAARRLGLMVAVAVVVFAGVGTFMALRTLEHAREVARQDATFQADLAAQAIDAGLTLGQTTLSGMAAGFPTAQLLASPEKCQLLFAGLGPFRSGHIDIVHNDGRVACSSVSKRGAPSGATHAGAAWLSQSTAPQTSQISQPFTDRLTGSPAIAVVVPLPGADGRQVALATFVLVLPALSESLAASYAGPRGFTFAVMADGSALSGPAVAGLAAGGSSAAQSATRLTGSAQAKAISWRIEASVSDSVALGPTRALLLRAVGLGVAALALVLVLLFLVNRQIARPLDRLAVAEHRLRASEERLQLLLHGARDYAIVLLDIDGRVASWSPSAQLLDGYAQEEILGRDYAVFFTTEELAAGGPAQSLSLATSTGRDEHEGVRVRQDGSRYWARTVITARRDAAGDLQGFVTVAHDATVRREVELAITRMNAELEQRVEERTTQLELQAAQLGAANAELEAFSYSVSHDLRAPLRSIGRFAAILAERCAEGLPEQAGHYAARIVVNAETLTNMVEALLGLSATQQQAMNAKSLDLTTLARSAWDELASDLDGRSVEFLLRPLSPGLGDPRLVRQVLANLLGNALKYTMKQDHATIEVGSQVTADATVYFVRDNGAGFDMRHADELFQVFRRLHSAGDYPGTGIGLASVRRIITRHGGQVWAEGLPNHGATFYFTLSPATTRVSYEPALSGPAPGR